MTAVDAGSAAVAAGTEIPLWPGAAPGSEGMTAPELVEPTTAERDHIRVSRIHKPSLTVFLAPPATATGAAVIVAPGGAHRWLSMDIEGYHVAEYLTSIGVATFVLKYRLAREEDSPYQVEVHALQDAQRAIRLVRSRASEWGVDPARVVMLGFSAGARVTALAATRFDAGRPDAADPVERQSARPDGQALIYGGAAGGIPTFAPDTPPAFLLGAADDRLGGESLPKLYLALREAGVSAELHLYASGGHGFGIRKPPKPFPSAATWQYRFVDWLADRGLLRGDGAPAGAAS